MSGTARIDPPPPTRPRTKPTITPDRLARRCCRSKITAGPLQQVYRQAQVAHAVAVWFGQMACAHVDLDRGQNELGHAERGIARFPHRDELVLADAFVDVD